MKRAVAVFLILLGLALALQWAGGVYRSELGGHPDEAAHYVTGLMIRDYLAARCPGSPLAFAENYYRHYPKIGLGVWPPFFYLLQAAATLPFGGTPGVVLALVAAAAAAAATLVYLAVRPAAGEPAAAMAGLALVALPACQEAYGMVMAESVSALLMFGATLLFGRFLEGGKARDSLGFGLLAALAILTKGTGLALAMVPPLALLVAGRWEVLRRRSLWGAALIVVVLAGPWTWKFRALGHGGWVAPHPTWAFTAEAVRYYAAKLVAGAGFAPLALAGCGVALMLVRQRRLEGRWAACAALPVAICLFQAILPVGLEARHLVPALPPVIALAFVGAVRLGELVWPTRPPGSAPGLGGRVFAACLLGAVLATQFRVVEKRFGGFAAPVAAILGAADAGGEILVSSDARGEGMFIAELATRDRRPGRTVQRASKFLAASTWSGAGYSAHFTDPAAVVNYLNASRVRQVVIDDSMPGRGRRAHHRLLAEAVAASGTFERARSFAAVRDGRLMPGAIGWWTRPAGSR